jgi:hypothetical protein
MEHTKTVSGTCKICSEPFSYEKKLGPGGARTTCDGCLGSRNPQKRYYQRNKEATRLRHKAWRDKKRAEAGIVAIPRTEGKKKRREIKLSVRFAIIKRDNSTCQYCGARAPDVRLTVDHIVAVAHGGTNDPSNLITACADCNFGKNDLVFCEPAA